MQAGLSALIVEDNAQMRLLLSEVLREAGVPNIATAGSVGEARQRCQYGGYAFALVDVGMGGESGLDFIRGIRRDPLHPSHRMPMLVVSGQAQRATIESARAAGANGFLVKPVRAADLMEKLEKLLRSAFDNDATPEPGDAAATSDDDVYSID